MKQAHAEGFSLVEILIALTILAVGLMAIMRLFPMALRQAQGAAERTVASQLADSRLGAVRTVNAQNALEYFPRYTQSPLQGGSTYYTLNSVEDVYASYEMYGGYNMALQRTAGAGKDALARVVFSVKMNDGRSERFVTYVASP